MQMSGGGVAHDVTFALCVGINTGEVLAELGFDAAEIATLERDGVARTAGKSDPDHAARQRGRISEHAHVRGFDASGRNPRQCLMSRMI